MPTHVVENRTSLWSRFKRWLRKFFIYPRRFKVTMRNPLTGETTLLDFTATDKFEDTGRFAGDCVETIDITPQDYNRLFRKKGLWGIFS